ncbi:MAG: anti-sigma factor family protein [Aridibacter sp.]
MNCRDFQELIDSYLSDELLTETNHDVLRHLEDCANCRNVIKARREVREHLKSAVINSPQYQIGKNFTHNLRTQLKYEALQNQEVNSIPQFGFKSWIAVAAGLILVFTFGFILLNNSENTNQSVAEQNSHLTDEVPANHLVNVAFSDHLYCGIKHGSQEPIKFVETPAKYEKVEQIAMPELENVLAGCKLKEAHTCIYKNTKFTHLIVEKNNEILSVLLTDETKADKLGEKIAYYSSKDYQMARFDVNDTTVFVISGLNKQTNSQVAQALYNPLRKYLTDDRNMQTAELTFY